MVQVAPIYLVVQVKWIHCYNHTLMVVLTWNLGVCSSLSLKFDYQQYQFWRANLAS